MSIRTQRINELLRKEISWILTKDIRDPRLSMLVTVTQVEVSSDLRQANIYVSILGTDLDKQDTVQTLRAASGFIQRELKPRLALKYVPYLFFKLDTSIEEGMHMLEIMDNIKPGSRTT
ncbi:MAG: 30S ribosome-binding factor RbfA [Chloroflexota bacterium]|jgi:ribosome-binding factor A|nr:30S ribosome-binding factor RbfA [Chloroflexota bacterium]